MTCNIIQTDCLFSNKEAVGVGTCDDFHKFIKSIKRKMFCWKLTSFFILKIHVQNAGEPSNLLSLCFDGHAIFYSKTFFIACSSKFILLRLFFFAICFFTE